MRKTNISAAIFSGIGDRSQQEDGFLVGKDVFLSDIEKEKMANDRSFMLLRKQNVSFPFMCAVSDGMGGQAAGEKASAIIISELNKRYERMLEERRDAAAIAEEIVNINDELCRVSMEKLAWRGMGATLSAVIADETQVLIIHVGDSRVYLKTEKDLEQITKDHTEGRRLMDMGLLTEEEEKRFPYRKRLYKYMGREGRLTVDLKCCSMRKGQHLLICSDGISDILTDQEISASFEQIEDQKKAGTLTIVDFLAKKVKEKDEDLDNMTAVALSWTDK